jgi:hypothetical protein
VALPIEVAPSKNSTAPVGACPTTVATIVTGSPTVTLLGVALTLVVDAALSTSTVVAADVDATLSPSPE